MHRSNEISLLSTQPCDFIKFFWAVHPFGKRLEENTFYFSEFVYELLFSFNSVCPWFEFHHLMWFMLWSLLQKWAAPVTCVMLLIVNLWKFVGKHIDLSVHRVLYAVLHTVSGISHLRICRSNHGETGIGTYRKTSTRRKRISFQCERNPILDKCHVKLSWKIFFLFLFWRQLKILNLASL